MTQMTFQQLKKLSKKDTSALPRFPLAVMGDCATQHLATAIRGYGVSVHRQDCPNADPAKRKESEKGRWVPVSWGRSEQDLYQTTLEISAKDRTNLFLDVAAALSAAQIRVDTLTAKGMPDGFALITVVISIRNREELDKVMKKLHSVRGVLGVQRARG